MYSLSEFQRYQALQCLPLSDQCPSELMDKMLVLLPEDEKPGFSSEVCLWTASQLIFEHILVSESISDPCGMALRMTNCGRSVDDPWTIHGCSLPVQALSDQFEDVYAMRCHNLSSRYGAHISLPRSSSCSSASEEGGRDGSSGVCWYHLQLGDEASLCPVPTQETS